MATNSFFDTDELKATAELIKNPWYYILAVAIIFWSAQTSSNLTAVTLTALFGLTLVKLTLIDLKHMILPFIITVPATLLSWIALPYFAGVPWFYVIGSSLFAFGLFFAIFYITFKIKGEPGMGFGDVVLMALLGAWVGALNIPVMLIIATLSALGAIIIRHLLKMAHFKAKIPFGPSLCLGAWLTFLYHELIWMMILTARQGLLNL